MRVFGSCDFWYGDSLPDGITEMCSGSEAGSYLRLIDFVYHSTLGLRVIKKKKRITASQMQYCAEKVCEINFYAHCSNIRDLFVFFKSENLLNFLSLHPKPETPNQIRLEAGERRGFYVHTTHKVLLLLYYSQA